MSFTTSGWIGETTRLRSALRKAGITRRLALMRGFLGSKDYELRVDKALSSLIRPGDCVWDVGANVGLYTERFAEAVGSSGKVVAFEPIARTHEALVERTQRFGWVQARQEALGAARASISVALEDDPTSPTNSLTHTPASTSQRVQLVSVVGADDLVRNGDIPLPAVVKIDTEGFEEDVVWGMRETLRHPQLRGLVIEVHFAILEGRGFRDAPARLCSLLNDSGFQVRWVDTSHLLATRSA